MERDVDVAIIGAGTAGINALSEVRKVTEEFVLINGGPLGTTCARVGCMPSKVLIQIGDDFHRRHVLDREGIGRAEGLTMDLGKALSHVRALRDRFVDGLVADTIAPLKDRFIEGYAEFIEPALLKVGEDRIRTGRTVIATGSRPLVPAQWSRLEDRILTTDTVFEQRRLPQRLAVLGLGPVGVELGQALARMGITVTGFDTLSGIGGLQDPEVNSTAVEIIAAELTVHLGDEAEIEEERGGLRVTSGDESAAVDKVLVSIGRIPNLEKLRLDRLGVALDDQGLPPFNRNTLQVADLPLFIAGDVNDDRPVLHEASYQGKVAGYNAARETAVRFERNPQFSIAFCDPNLTVVGASWDEIKDRDPAVGTARCDGGREKIMLRDQGMIRVYGERSSGRLLGAEMAAPGGEHLAHLLAWSIQQSLSVYDLLRMPFYHPAVEETLLEALEDLAAQVQGAKPSLLGLRAV